MTTSGEHAMKIAKSTIAATVAGLMTVGAMVSPLSAATVHTNTTNAHRNDVYDMYRDVAQSDPVTVRTSTSNAHRNDVYDIYREVPLVENTPVEIKTSNPHRSDVYDLYAN